MRVVDIWLLIVNVDLFMKSYYHVPYYTVLSYVVTVVFGRSFVVVLLLLLLEEEKVSGVEKWMEIDGIPGIVGE